MDKNFARATMTEAEYAAWEVWEVWDDYDQFAETARLGVADWDVGVLQAVIAEQQIRCTVAEAKLALLRECRRRVAEATASKS